MAVFKYKAVSLAGKTSAGFIDADSTTLAASKLRGKGLYPLEITPSHKRSRPVFTTFGLETLFRMLFRRVSKKIVASTVRQLSTLLGAGLPLETCLTIMVDKCGHRELHRVLSLVRERVREGLDLAGAFEKHPHVFSPMFVAMVRSGEASGSLEVVMEGLSEHLELQLALNRKLQATMAYPTLMLLVGVLVVVFLLSFVVPKVTQIFADLDHILPLPTRILIGLSTFFRDFWPYILVTLTVVLLAASRLAKTKKGERIAHRLRLRLPVIGGLIRQLYVGRLTRTFGMLLKNGVVMVQALDVIKNIIPNVVFENALVNIQRDVKEGKGLADPMASSGLFDNSVIQLVDAGEKSGQLEHMLLVIARDCETEVNAKIQMLTSLMEPLLILVLGGMVGFVVLAIILPIFEMSNLVR